MRNSHHTHVIVKRNEIKEVWEPFQAIESVACVFVADARGRVGFNLGKPALNFVEQVVA